MPNARPHRDRAFGCRTVRQLYASCASAAPASADGDRNSGGERSFGLSLVADRVADLGTIDDANAALDTLAADSARTYEEVLEINASYLDGQHPFPERVHVSVLFATFQLELFDLIMRWSEFAKAELEAWPTTEDLGMTDRTREILETITQRRSVLDASSEAP